MAIQATVEAGVLVLRVPIVQQVLSVGRLRDEPNTGFSVVLALDPPSASGAKVEIPVEISAEGMREVIYLMSGRWSAEAEPPR
jgi:hypothetical protein